MTVLPSTASSNPPESPWASASPEQTLVSAASIQDAISEIRQTVWNTGLITWATLSLHSALVEPTRDKLPREDIWSWGVVNLCFVALFVLTMRLMGRTAFPAALVLLGLQTTAILTGNAFLNGSSVQAGLLILVAAQVALILPFRPSVIWVGMQSLVLLGVLLSRWQNLDAWAFTTGYFCFQVLAVTTVRTAVREVQARQQLDLLVNELRTTRELLNQASRQAERLHLSRELHDLLGHQLTAQGMHLQVALHHLPANSEARSSIDTAQRVGQQLLNDVRSTVRGLRETSKSHFCTDLTRLIEGTPLTVHLNWPPAFHLTCPLQSQVLLRTVQEILTNASRHGQARQVWLDFKITQGHLTLNAHDDGCGTQRIDFGCGLTGMQERLESIGGQMTVRAQPGSGVELLIRLPLRSQA